MAQGRKTGGRKPGSQNLSTRLRLEAEAKERAEIAAAIQQEASSDNLPPDVIRHMSPVEIMEYAMHLRARAGDWDGAADRARDVAPYRQPRLSNQTLNVRNDDSQRSLAELEQERADLARRRAALAGAAGIGDRPGDVAPGVPEQPGGMVH